MERISGLGIVDLVYGAGFITGIFSQGLPAILHRYDVSPKVIGFTSLLAIRGR